MYYANKNKNKKKNTEKHDNTPLLVVETDILFRLLCGKCSAKPKIKKRYCYTDVLPYVLRVKTKIMEVYKFYPKTVEDFDKEDENMNELIKDMDNIILSIKSMSTQGIFPKEMCDRLLETANKTKTQLIKWRRSENARCKKRKEEERNKKQKATT